MSAEMVLSQMRSDVARLSHRHDPQLRGEFGVPCLRCQLDYHLDRLAAALSTEDATRPTGDKE